MIRVSGADRERVAGRRNDPAAAHAPPSRRGLRRSLAWRSFLVAPMVAGAGLLLASVSGRGRLALFSIAVSAMAACATLFAAAWLLAPRHVTPRVGIVVHAGQVLWLGLMAALDLPTVVPGMATYLDVADHPLAATAPLLLAPAAAVLVAAVLRLPVFGGRAGILEDASRRSPPGLAAILVMGGAAMVLFWPATLGEAGVAGYAIRVLNYGLLFTSFLAGRYGSRRVLTFWWLCVALNAAISLTTGARYFALLPPALFVAGRLADPNARNRRRLLALSAGAAAAAVALSGLVGVVRNRVGRAGFEEVTVGRALEVGDAALEAVGDAPGAAVGAQGVGRMISWANQAAFVLTPDIVPYRGLEGLWSEIGSAMSIAALSGKTREDALDEGLYQAPATLYGFMVTGSTSVEFPLLADGWSRGGPWVASAFALFALLVAGLAETVAMRLRARWRTPALVIFVLAGKLAIDIGGVPPLAAVRSLALHGVLLGTLAMIVTSVSLRISSGARARPHPLAPGRAVTDRLPRRGPG